MNNLHLQKIFILLTLITFSLESVSLAGPLKTDLEQSYGDATYRKPKAFDFIYRTPGDVKDVTKDAFRRENIPTWIWVSGATGLLLLMDQHLVDEAKRLGNHLGISHSNYQKTFARIKIPLLNKDLNIEGPFDSGSALYFLGDGWTDVGIIGGFFGYGIATNNNRALQTSSQIAESILASGAVVQTLKHITGRESPFTTEVSGGVWRFFPNQIRYSHHVPEFDAFPSGHVAAAMATVTVISENYPEYEYIRPLGYSLIGVLGFQMMNNGVHWASDYPLSLVMGYSFGRMAVKKGRRNKNSKTELQLFPYASHQSAGAVLTVRFRG